MEGVLGHLGLRPPGFPCFFCWILDVWIEPDCISLRVFELVKQELCCFESGFCVVVVSIAVKKDFDFVVDETILLRV